jgi:hypothetical protein
MNGIYCIAFHSDRVPTLVGYALSRSPDSWARTFWADSDNLELFDTVLATV